MGCLDGVPKTARSVAFQRKRNPGGTEQTDLPQLGIFVISRTARAFCALNELCMTRCHTQVSAAGFAAVPGAAEGRQQSVDAALPAQGEKRALFSLKSGGDHV